MAKVWQEFSPTDMLTPQQAMLLDQGITGQWVDQPDVPVTVAQQYNTRSPYWASPAQVATEDEALLRGELDARPVTVARPIRSKRRNVVPMTDYTHDASAVPPLVNMKGYVYNQPGSQLPQEYKDAAQPSLQSADSTTQTVVVPVEKNIYDTYEKPRTKSLSSWWQKDLASNPLMWGLINRIMTLQNVFKNNPNAEIKYADPLSRWR